MKDYICDATTAVGSLRCWKRNGHQGEHLTVIPAMVKDELYRPLVRRWT